MDSEYIQQTRYKLQKRLKRLNIADTQTFHFNLIQVWGFLCENEVAKGILVSLESLYPEHEVEAQEILGGQMRYGTTEATNASLCYWVMRLCAESTKSDIEALIGMYCLGSRTMSDGIEAFRLAFVEPLFDYIDESIDDKRMVLVLLKKFKQRCEWFRRSEMYLQFKEDTGIGEKILASCLYEYLHDQGINFHVEPQSASGRVDLISDQSGSDRIVADAKLFNPQRGQDRGYLVKGFRQVYEYTKDFGEVFGYLVVFKTCEQDISIPTEKQESSVPFITHNNKIIFVVVIDIFEYSQPASKRGKLSSYEITPQQFIESLCEKELMEAAQFESCE